VVAEFVIAAGPNINSDGIVAWGARNTIPVPP
jgi:hypothetical protein